MRLHLYEFRTDTKKLRCTCGWERTVRSTDAAQVSKKFSEHCAQAALKA